MATLPNSDLERICPLLVDGEYKCDLDLSEPQAREYWLGCIFDMLEKFRIQARQSQEQDDSTAEERANQFYTTTKAEITKCAEDEHTIFAIRTLLDLMQTCLRRYGFDDPWREKKRLENQLFLEEFAGRLCELDQINDLDAKWTELIKGVLAGNMFDWGAKAVTEILEEDRNFGLKSAMSRILDCSWIFNGLPKWLSRIKDRPYRCAAVFVDNSGCDIVLGIMPFVRQLLLQKTRIILCANSQPAINDVTWTELKEVVESCCQKCDILATAYAKQELVIYANGQSGPCLNMKSLPPELCAAMSTNGTDLLVLEGMGRAVHTNLYAQFKCDSLKLAILKNEWLAQLLGGSLFSVLCQYETL